MRSINVKIKQFKPIITSADTMVTPKVIEDWLKEHEAGNAERFKQLKEYLDGGSIIDSGTTGSSQSDSVVIINYPELLTNTQTSFYMSSPVAYSLSEKKAAQNKLLEMVQRLAVLNEDDIVNEDIATYAAAYGTAFELSWASNEFGDSEVVHRYVPLDPQTAFLVYDDTVEQKPLYGIRYTRNDKGNGELFFCDYEKEERYVLKKQKITLDETYTRPNPFKGKLRMRECKNNTRRRSVFEPVLSPIEANNQMQTTTLNNFEYLADALFYIEGGQGMTQEDLEQMMEARALQLPDGMKAGFIEKGDGGSASEEFKKRLDMYIHKVSMVPDTSDENFAGNSSGVAMGYKLIGLKSIVSRAARHFEVFLRERIACTAALMNITEKTLYDENYIKVDFTFNIPANDIETANLINALEPYLPLDTLLSLLSFVDDAQAEIDAKQEEEEDSPDEYVDQNQDQKVLAAENPGTGADKQQESSGNKQKE
ncbi:phage portal protein [Culicoidibacter larvae]|uniref:Phage portal protein n=1 Tax=Culicoidibacter larvae TaxID=2579976 RepID=A0A5R8Q9T5_9FIRM|nr:phage portal protein [Culicoidibacter larvae]TLG71383.1 phage portal protein [Culicoidibacter larvae]